MIALDIATKCGICYDRGNVLYIGTVEGDPIYQCNYILSLISPSENVAIESLNAFNAPNPRTLIISGARVGHISYSLMECYEVQFYTPAQWRGYLSLKNNKNGTKVLQEFIHSIVPDVYLNLDEVDSVGIWLRGKDLYLDNLRGYQLVKLPRKTQPKAERVSCL